MSRADERKAANLAIIELLKQGAEKYPDLRFGQLMTSLDVIKHEPDACGGLKIRDEFYVESEPLLNRIKEAADKLGL